MSLTADPRLAGARTALSGLRDVDDRMAASRQRILAELDRLPRPFDRDADPVHLTASAIVVSTRGVLLHVHRRMQAWMQPGGHIDAGESPADGAVRETREETGLAPHHPPDGPRLVHVDVHDTADGHTHLDLRYLLVAPAEDPKPPPGESQQVRWFGWDEAIAVADAGLRGALAALRPEARTSS